MQGNTIVLPAGQHRFVGTTVVPEGVTLEIDAGAELWMAAGASLVCHGPVRANGTEAAPIRVLTATAEPWGTFAVVRPGAESAFRHVYVTGGAGATTDGITFTGALAIHDGDAVMESCEFAGCPAEDAVNVKNGRARIASCTFVGNDSDDIDLDFVQGEVVQSRFSDTGGDAVDVSGTEVTIAGNRIERAGDKGISVGEQSNVLVIDNVLTDNLIAVAIKDGSQVRIEKCTMTGNDMAVAAYRKKPIFGGGNATVKDCVILDTRKPVIADAHSTIELESCVMPEDAPAHGSTAGTQDLQAKSRSSGLVHDSYNPPAG
jgi:parallel beta-helix repeat protein